jgi:hypothetical protein
VKVREVVFSILKIILRNTRRVKLYALINIVGLSVGLIAVNFFIVYTCSFINNTIEGQLAGDSGGDSESGGEFAI